MSSRSKMYEQRVVYAALQRMSNDRNLVKAAYARWESEYKQLPLDVFEVVADLTSFLGLDDAERKTLMIAMHAASSRHEDELPAVPAYISSSDAVAPAREASEAIADTVRSLPAHIAVTERYLQLVCQYVKRSNSESFRELVDIVKDEGLPKLDNILNVTVKSWGASGLDKINFSDSARSYDCKEVALEFYVLLTEIIGPVESDVIVNKAVGDVLNMEEAQRFNPRELL